jgi:ABC-type branched-subunit amino acid transport system ATPase component
MTLLEAERVSVSFGGVHALSEVDCDVHEGEILGILGPNGAGKTTLLNALSRLVAVGRGAALRFSGRDITRARPHELARLGLARTFQGIELSPADTLLDNVLTGAHVRRGRGARDEAQALMGTFGIERWSERPARDAPYAVGKRAQICRALLCRPQLLLLDEPAAGMTAGEKDQLREALAGVHRETGVALAVIEHGVGFLTRLADRLLALNFGRVIAAGTVATVVKDPHVIEAYLGTDDD